MFLILLLLFCFISYIETPAVTPKSVTGQKGKNTTMPCDFEARDIFQLDLFKLSKKIPVCQNETCNGRFVKNGACDIFIKYLGLSDAGKYTLRVHYNSTETVLEPKEKTYHLQIHDDVKKGGKLLDGLLPMADKVQYQSNASSPWRKVWTRDNSVDSDSILDNLTATDTGTYRVLDSNNETLITVTVTGSVTEERTDDHHKTNYTDHTGVYWFLRVGLPVIMVLVGVIVFFVIKKHQCLNRHYLPPASR